MPSPKEMGRSDRQQHVLRAERARGCHGHVGSRRLSRLQPRDLNPHGRDERHRRHRQRHTRRQKGQHPRRLRIQHAIRVVALPPITRPRRVVIRPPLLPTRTRLHPGCDGPPTLHHHHGSVARRHLHPTSRPATRRHRPRFLGTSDPTRTPTPTRAGATAPQRRLHRQQQREHARNVATETHRPDHCRHPAGVCPPPDLRASPQPRRGRIRGFRDRNRELRDAVQQLGALRNHPPSYGGAGGGSSEASATCFGLVKSPNPPHPDPLPASSNPVRLAVCMRAGRLKYPSSCALDPGRA